MSTFPLKVLIIEDSTLAFVAENKLLIDAISCQLQHAATGKAALELLQKEKYDLIFMDECLPDLSGHEITHSIRQDAHHLNRGTPIVGVTAEKDRHVKHACIEAGMNAVLSKPLTSDAIKTILNSFDLTSLI